MKTEPSNTSKHWILAKAVELARKKGLHKFSRKDVGKAAETAESTVSYHFGTMTQLRIEITKHAVEFEMLDILADACSSRGRARVTMSAELKKKVAAYIAS